MEARGRKLKGDMAVIEYSFSRNKKTGAGRSFEFWTSDDNFYEFVEEFVQVAIDATAHRNRLQRIVERLSVDGSDLEAFYE